ncbi:hypothetical protein OPKNFCMD_3259 [Methylobacterium crusticola]|uniref:Uncharacterized protein n=1 Tax=Methylobacterium crusticola TaxID=1697972 RepID=A0ABQ4QZQ3_9HYPH|nr:hypothetical protein [Methylobacterium crusticola]GJD50516.1 hypothetical protein OPKNFCMD_3259 [Methylobacterium crusticola]
MSPDPAPNLVAEIPLRPMTPALVLFGRDESGRPRAAWFDASEAKLAAQAAGLMKLRVLHLANDEQRRFADEFTHGRVFSSGRAFVPYVRRELYPRLVEIAGGSSPSLVEGGAKPSGKPPAAVKPPEGPAVAQPAKAAAKPAARPAERAFVGNPQPQDRDEIGLGSFVLVTEGPSEGWWEAEVIGINGGVFSLRWRDYPTEPTLLRRAGEVALLPPGHA